MRVTLESTDPNRQTLYLPRADFEHPVHRLTINGYDW
jgi:nitrogen fixation protein